MYNNFKGHIKGLQEIHSTYSPKRIALGKKIAEEESAYKRSLSSIDEVQKAEALVRWDRYRKVYYEIVEELREVAEAEIAKQREALEDDLKEFYAPKADEVDEDITKLLNSGIQLTSEEIEGYVDANMHNPTMLRMLSDYCEKQGIGCKKAKELGELAKDGGKQELEIFDRVANKVRLAMSDAKANADVWGADEKFFSEEAEKAISELDALSVKPGNS